jgi:glycosyltransferase involved in cell wall biosynthesis
MFPWYETDINFLSQKGMANISKTKPMPVLYITYDGLLDPLGGSQILPYIKGISSSSRRFIILSFEKRHRFVCESAALKEELDVVNIGWFPLVFTQNFGLVGKLWDLLRMYFFAWYIALRDRVWVVHARGHAAAQVGLSLKVFWGLKLIFDFRGLWVDERVDKGGWDLSRPFDRIQYRYFKRIERKLLASADQVVVLTTAVVGELHRLCAKTNSKINVIPCSADFNHFVRGDDDSRILARCKLGIPRSACVVGYVGSIGRLYRIDRFLRLFELAAKNDDGVHGLAITNDTIAFGQLVESLVPRNLRSRMHVYSASRAEVPIAIGAMDISVCFIQPSYARMAASPTKLAECFAMGIPAICNAGVGDVEEQVNLLGGGVVIDPNSDADLFAVAGQLSQVAQMGGARLREVAEPVLGLDFAIARYLRVYNNL